jgi:hypothetical protein
MPLMKHVDGEDVPMTPEEEAAFEATRSVEPDPVPQVISRFQGRAALLAMGKLDAADALVAASSNPLVKMAWAEVSEFHRDSATLNAMAAEIGVDLDAVFTAGAQIKL